MDVLDELLETEAQIREWESCEDFHSGDRGYQRLLERKEELLSILQAES